MVITSIQGNTMGFYSFIGYDKKGEITELNTNLNKNQLSTGHIVLASLGWNAPAWVSAATLPLLYMMVGRAAPLVLLVTFISAIVIIALTMVYLVRQAPSAAGAFTFTEKFVHPFAGVVIGTSYITCAIMILGMNAHVATTYIRAFIPAIEGPVAIRIVATLYLVILFIIAWRGVSLNAKVAAAFLATEVAVVVGLGIAGIVSPHVEGVSIAQMYSLSEVGGITGLIAGVSVGIFILCGFDTTINFIEEARTPVRTVQRSLIIVIVLVFVIYSVATIGWQRAIPFDVLTQFESGDGGPIAAVAAQYLTPSFSWIAVVVVITSTYAAIQVALMSGARAAYRMSEEGYLPSIFKAVNKHKTPWFATTVIAGAGLFIAWIKDMADMNWYIGIVSIAIILNFASVLVAFIFAVFKQKTIPHAIGASILPLFAICFMIYCGYVSGPTAWIAGFVIIIAGLALGVISRKRKINIKENTISDPVTKE